MEGMAWRVGVEDVQWEATARLVGVGEEGARGWDVNCKDGGGQV